MYTIFNIIRTVNYGFSVKNKIKQEKEMKGYTKKKNIDLQQRKHKSRIEFASYTDRQTCRPNRHTHQPLHQPLIDIFNKTLKI